MKLLIAMSCAIAGLVSLADTTSAALFRDQMNDGSGWSANVGGTGDSQFEFNYDYSLDGIPEAPNGEGGDAAARGVKMEANLVDPTGGEFFTLYPNGQNFTGDYQLRFDSWSNFATDGSGTTEFSGGGIGYDNVTADIASGAQAIATSEGGSGNDWRAFKSPPQFFVGAAEMAGGTRQGSDSYYSDFLPSVASPAVQAQGSSVAGSPGFQWITWEFNVVGNDVSILIEKTDGSRLGIVSYDKTDTADTSAGVSTDGNISLFYADFFSSVANTPALQFGVVDNVIVTQIPEPSSLALLSLSGLALLRRRRR